TPVVTPTTSLPNDALIVKLSAKPTFTAEQNMPRGPERKTAVWEKLVNTAQTSQAEVIKLAEQLKESGAIKGYETLVSPNAVLIQPASGKQKELASTFGTTAGVRTVYDNRGNPLFANGALVNAQDGHNLIGKGQPFTGLD